MFASNQHIHCTGFWPERKVVLQEGPDVRFRVDESLRLGINQHPHPCCNFEKEQLPERILILTHEFTLQSLFWCAPNLCKDPHHTQNSVLTSRAASVCLRPLHFPHYVEIHSIDYRTVASLALCFLSDKGSSISSSGTSRTTGASSAMA